MVNVNKVIGSNITSRLKENGKKQIDLANHLGVSKQVVSNMLGGARAINAVELQQIAAYFHIPMEKLVVMPAEIQDTDVIRAFMGKVETEEAKKGLEIADQIADVICFYANANETAKKMMQPWEA